ncbi:MAG: hypothetical protein M1358_07755 [Chloroflexi bacterium]|nr:hypothetical protein [Chloroflexota bacterium]
MNKYFFAVLTALLVASIGFTGCSSTRARAGGVLTVDDIFRDPFAYKGTITFTGVVAEISKDDPSLFAVIDTREAITCKRTNCASFYIPVRSYGKVPQEWDEVNVTGSAVRTTRTRGQFRVAVDLLWKDTEFTATQVDIVRHLTF